MLSRTLLCLAVISASTPLLADTVWLKNGDRLTGKIKVFDGGKLLIQTDYAGAIPVDWKQVKTLESDQELLVKQDAYTGEKAKSLKAAGDGKVTLVNGEAPKTVDLASIKQIIKPKPVIEDLVWKGNVDLALDYKRADQDTDDYDIAFKTTARHGAWRHNAQGEYNREFQNDVSLRLDTGENLLLVSHQPLVGNLLSLLQHGNVRQPEPMGTASLAELEGELPLDGAMTLLSVRHP